MHLRLAANKNPNKSGHNFEWMPRAPRASHHRVCTLSNAPYGCCDATIDTVHVWDGGTLVETARQFVIHTGSQNPLYTAVQKARRDATRWTLVQGILAPVQFVAFAVSLCLVIRYLATGEGLGIATASVVVKTALLYTIMITGSIWEKVVFGKYLFVPAFFWEDVFSMLVLALHTAYLAAIVWSIGTGPQQMWLALAAYAAYAINATQFILKLRAARLQERNEQQTERVVLAGAAS